MNILQITKTHHIYCLISISVSIQHLLKQLPVNEGRLELLIEASLPISNPIPLKSVLWFSVAECGSDKIKQEVNPLNLFQCPYH